MLVHAPTALGQTIDETAPIEPKWGYPASKVRTEDLIRRQRAEVPVVFLRIAGVYHDRCGSRLTARVYPGDIRRSQAFVHLEDVIDAIERAVARRRDPPAETVLLIGEPETLSYEALQGELGRLLHGEDWDTREIPKALAKTGAWVLDAMPLEEGVHQALGWSTSPTTTRSTCGAPGSSSAGLPSTVCGTRCHE